MPMADKLLEELYDVLIFSKFDLKSKSHQIHMWLEDINKTTFHTHHRHYEYIVMPFGLIGTLAIF